MDMTLTTETIKLWRNNAEITAGETAENDPEHIAAKAILALTAELLANREAQPAGFYTTVSGRKGVIWHNGAPEDDTAIYTAPPAPAVPDGVMPGGLVYSSALPKFESNDSDKIVGYCCFISGETRSVESQEQAYADAKAVINACRAAMLAQPVSSGYTFNSPVIPDGWKLVPIDATRAMIDAAQRVEEDGYDAMHKAMLAAAPDGGNDHDTRR
ncbi:hypothetical protein QZP90_06360 [Serratia marcescens]|uniref:hypothetical protein n=1 Tax=Serratia marcescens TaxID=615 RepID=UPI00275410FF|nr:hypothetical protein [Serratia marcescens]MDP8733141.1 hypothetical protein [Serratia marcescens]